MEAEFNRYQAEVGAEQRSRRHDHKYGQNQNIWQTIMCSQFISFRLFTWIPFSIDLTVFQNFLHCIKVFANHAMYFTHVRYNCVSFCLLLVPHTWIKLVFLTVSYDLVNFKSLPVLLRSWFSGTRPSTLRFCRLAFPLICCSSISFYFSDSSACHCNIIGSTAISCKYRQFIHWHKQKVAQKLLYDKQEI